MLIDRGLKKDNSGEYKEWNDIIHSNINADILIQGNSRANRHISPYAIDTTFNAHSYNIGISGYGFFMQYYRFLFYMEYNKAPKYIIQNIDATMTLAKGDSLYQYSQFLPYLYDTIIKRAVTSYYGLDWKDFYIPLYKYHSLYSEVYSGLLANIHKRSGNNGKYKGFLAEKRRWDNEFEEFKLQHPKGYYYHVNNRTLGLFTRFLEYCKQNNISVIFVCTPEYYEAQKMLINRDSIMHIYKNYSIKYNVPILDYSNDSICRDSNNFYNSQHLNNIGAKKFNTKLVQDLKKLIH